MVLLTYILQDIPDFPGYKVNQKGEVYSFLKNKPKKIKPIIDKKGRMVCSLYRDGVLFKRLFHRLVMETFVGPRPKHLIVCHNDGNPANNCLNNLRYDTYQSNSDDAVKHKTIKTKLKSEEVLEIREKISIGITRKEICSKYNLSKSSIRDIVTRKTWRHI